MPLFDKWVVVLTGPRLIEELRKVPEDELSFDHAMRDVCWKFLFCSVTLRFNTRFHSFFKSNIHLASTPKNIPITSKSLATISLETFKRSFLMFTTRSLTHSAPSYHQPKMASFTTFSVRLFLRSFCAGWAKVRIYPEIMKAMCRVSNRLFVGLPLCKWFA